MLPEKFNRYMTEKNIASTRLTQFYQQSQHLSKKWNLFVGKQKSESKLINKMKELYGDFVVVMGDWSDAGHTARYQASSKTKGWRTTFKRNHIKCFLLDEYRTSSVCPNCNRSEHIEKGFKTRLSSRPWLASKGQNESVHGLLGKKRL